MTNRLRIVLLIFSFILFSIIIASFWKVGIERSNLKSVTQTETITISSNSFLDDINYKLLYEESEKRATDCEFLNEQYRLIIEQSELRDSLYRELVNLYKKKLSYYE